MLETMREQLATLLRIAGSPLSVPAVAGMAPAASGLVVQVSGPLVSVDVRVSGVSGAEDIGLAVAEALEERRIGEILYRSLVRALRARGDVSVTPGMLQ
jgi:ribosomal protein S18 acetylase RimI-like enzyme